MAEDNFENNIENLLNHIADDNRISGEEFAEAVNKLETLIKENKSYNEEMIKSLREAIKLLSESKKYIGAFKAGSGKGEELDKDTAIYALNEFLKDLKEKNPELFKEKKSGGEPFSNTDIGSQLQKWFGLRNGNADREQKQMFQNLFNLTKRPNSDDDKDNKKTNKFLDGIKGFFSSRSFLGKLGATILGAIMDSKFLKGGLKDLIMFGVLLVSSWIRKHFGPVAGAITFFAPAIIGLVTKIWLAIKAWKVAQATWEVGKTIASVLSNIGGMGLFAWLFKRGKNIGGLPTNSPRLPGSSNVIEMVKDSSGTYRATTSATAGAIGSTEAKMTSKALGVAKSAPVIAGVADTSMSLLKGESLGRSVSGGIGAGLGTWGGLALGSAAAGGIATTLGLASGPPGWLALLLGALGAWGLSSLGSNIGKGTFDLATSSNSSNNSNSSNSKSSSWISNLLWTNLAANMGKGIQDKFKSNVTPGGSSGVIKKLDTTNTILNTILAVLKHRTNYNQFGFSDVQTDINGNQIGLLSKVGNWARGLISGSNSSNVTPSGVPNTYTSEGSFGGHGISSAFGAREAFRNHAHGGLDLRYKQGDAVGAKVAGVVKFAELGNGTKGANGGYGGLVVVSDEKGNDHYYAHLSKVLVNKGQQVSQGTILGLAGSTGESTGSHLHYEVRTSAGKNMYTGTSEDPMKVARNMGYDEAAEKKVFQAEEDYNKQYTSATKSKPKDVSRKSNQAVNNICVKQKLTDSNANQYVCDRTNYGG